MRSRFFMTWRLGGCRSVHIRRDADSLSSPRRIIVSSPSRRSQARPLDPEGGAVVESGMPISAAYHATEADVPSATEPGDTVSTRLTLVTGNGEQALEQRVLRCTIGRSQPRRHPSRHDLLYVVAGSGTLFVDGTPHALEPDTGAFVAGGEEHAIENPGPEHLVLVSVRTPATPPDESRRRVLVRYADQPALPASPNREFRYLVNQDAGCVDATQFVGVIPPGHAGMHSHTYDELIYVVEGEGVLHLHGQETPIGPGSCIHLPPLEEHCLENRGGTAMRVLGVFHPSGDPASRATEERT
jgi:mannose-6-phosphate isomerase-like protein (cupin superfamily)